MGKASATAVMDELQHLINFTKNGHSNTQHLFYWVYIEANPTYRSQ